MMLVNSVLTGTLARMTDEPNPVRDPALRGEFVGLKWRRALVLGLALCGVGAALLVAGLVLLSVVPLILGCAFLVLYAIGRGVYQQRP